MALEPGNRFRAGRLIRADDLAQVFHVELRRKLGGPHEVAEHHSELTALGSSTSQDVVRWDWPWTGWAHRGQKSAANASAAPHWMQVAASWAPHSAQNFAWDGVSLPHRGQCIPRPPKPRT